MHETEHLNNTLNKRVGWGSEATFSPECTSKCRDDKYKIAKWWCPVSKDRELALCKWMHLNPESRAIETRKHWIARVHDIQAYLLDTIQKLTRIHISPSQRNNWCCKQWGLCTLPDRGWTAWEWVFDISISCANGLKERISKVIKSCDNLFQHR
jgi:hypothetical protein